MKMQYLHLSAYSCDKCNGPVVAGSLAVRENEISKETDIRQVGAVCLACGHKQTKTAKPRLVRDFPPVLWEAAGNYVDTIYLAGASADALSPAEVH